MVNETKTFFEYVGLEMNKEKSVTNSKIIEDSATCLRKLKDLSILT